MSDEPNNKKDDDKQELSDGALGKVAGGAVDIFLTIDGIPSGEDDKPKTRPAPPPPTPTK